MRTQFCRFTVFALLSIGSFLPAKGTGNPMCDLAGAAYSEVLFCGGGQSLDSLLMHCPLVVGVQLSDETSSVLGGYENERSASVTGDVIRWFRGGDDRSFAASISWDNLNIARTKGYIASLIGNGEPIIAFLDEDEFMVFAAFYDPSEEWIGIECARWSTAYFEHLMRNGSADTGDLNVEDFLLAEQDSLFTGMWGIPLSSCFPPVQLCDCQPYTVFQMPELSSGVDLYAGISYPKAALFENRSGVAQIAFRVCADGEITSVTIVGEKPAGYGFGTSAFEAVSALKFIPAKLGAFHVSLDMQQTVHFDPASFDELTGKFNSNLE